MTEVYFLKTRRLLELLRVWPIPSSQSLAHPQFPESDPSPVPRPLAKAVDLYIQVHGQSSVPGKQAW